VLFQSAFLRRLLVVFCERHLDVMAAVAFSVTFSCAAAVVAATLRKTRCLPIGIVGSAWQSAPVKP
jgi:hypothetical protein